MDHHSSPLSGLTQRLVRQGHLSQAAARQALRQAQDGRVSLVHQLVASGAVPASRLAQAMAEEFGAARLDLDTFVPEVPVTELLDPALIARYAVLPLTRRDNRLLVAVSDPTDLAALEAIRFSTGLNVETVIAEDDKLRRWIKRIEIEQDGNAFGAPGNASSTTVDTSATANTSATADAEQAGADEQDAPVVRFVNRLLLDAVANGASDLHFEPFADTYRVRFRQDGVLVNIASPAANVASRVAARLKIMARLDIAERRVPQDGRIRLNLSPERTVDLRVNTCPTLHGEKIVLRILDPDSARLDLDTLGYTADQRHSYLHALQKSQGMILVTGPTGSGKTVSLYAGVNRLNTPERNLCAVEDPVEIALHGINQVNVNPKQGMDFATALRAFLRQDPDVILVGEIRDTETAEIAIKAAQTGHLVLSTLHTNSAPETLTRLRNMGIPSFNIATSVTLIIAQRLVRRLCAHCRTAVAVPEASLLEMGFTRADLASGFTLYGPGGCHHCNDGYRGRSGIYEVVSITDSIARLIMEEGDAIRIADQCRKEGFRDLYRAGLEKAMQGITSLEEVHRVTGRR